MSILPTLNSVSVRRGPLPADNRCELREPGSGTTMRAGIRYIWQKGWPLLLLLAAFACSAKREAVPPGVLDQQAMIRVLGDVLILEEKVTRLGLTGDSALIVFNSLRGKVFERSGVPDSVFKKSMDYYIDRPKQLEQIYSVLVDSLNLREQRASIRPELK